MIRIICHGCQHRFQRTAAQVLSEGRCPRCASTDIDADDGWDEKDASRRTAQSEANWVQDREVSGFWSANYGGITLEVQTGYDEPYEYLVDPGGDPGQIISGTSKTLEDAKANAEAVARNEFMASRRQAKAVCPDCNEEKDRPRFRIGRGFCHNAFHSAKPSAAQQKAAGASTSYYGDHWRLVYGDYEPLLWEVYADMDGDQPPIASGTGGNLQAGILGLQEALISAGFDDVVDLDSASSISRFSRFSRPRTAAVDPPNIAIAREVVRTRTFDRANGLDTFSASAIVQVYDALSESNKARFGAMSLAQMSDAAFRLLNKASTLQQPTDIGEPKKTMCPNCGTAQFNPVAGLCAQCGYTEDDFTKNEREARRIAAAQQKAAGASTSYYGDHWRLVYGDYEPLLWEVYADMDGDQPPIASGTGGNLQAGILGLQEALISAGFDDVVDLDSASSISRFSRFSRPRTAAVDPPNIAIAREVVRTRTFDRANGLDTFSASAIVQVYDALSESNKARFGAMSLAQMSDAAFRLLNKASTLQQPTDIGEPKKTMCPNCGTAQFNPVAGLCAQCGYTEDDFTKNEREARRIAAVEWKRTFAPYGENMGLWVQEAVINGRRMEKAEQYAMQYGQRTAAGPNGFWCPECGKYQSVRTSAEANAAREHMRGHKAGKVAGAAPSENIYSVLVGDEVGTYIVHYKDGHSDQNVLWEEMSEEAQSVWRNQHTSSAIEEVNAPFGPSNNVVSLAETARCSSCMAEFRYEASKPNASVPECPRCGSRATSPAGATGTGAKEASIVRDILASNPGMEHHMATAIAKETLRRFPKVAGSR